MSHTCTPHGFIFPAQVSVGVERKENCLQLTICLPSLAYTQQNKPNCFPIRSVWKIQCKQTPKESRNKIRACQCCGSVIFWYGSKSVPLTHGSGSGSCSFCQCFQDANKVFVYLLLFKGTFTSVFKDKKSQKIYKTVTNRGFSYSFCLMMEGSG